MQLLILMLGHPGSGKTYFTRQLAPKINAVRLNGDHMRTAMFGDGRLATRADNPKVFGAIEYAMVEVLKAGHAVVCDMQHNKRPDRKRLEQIAAEHGAKSLIIWIQTPIDIAFKRGIEREEADDQRRKTEEQMRESIAFFVDALEKPDDTEDVLVIDGTLPFEQQYAAFVAHTQRS